LRPRAARLGRKRFGSSLRCARISPALALDVGVGDGDAEAADRAKHQRAEALPFLRFSSRLTNPAALDYPLPDEKEVLKGERWGGLRPLDRLISWTVSRSTALMDVYPPTAPWWELTEEELATRLDTAEDLLNLLQFWRGDPRLNAWEQSFVAEIVRRIQKYRGKLAITPKQWVKIHQILDKLAKEPAEMEEETEA